jgi:hypothetical protein
MRLSYALLLQKARRRQWLRIVLGSVLLLIIALLFAIAAINTPVLTRMDLGIIWQTGSAQETQPVQDLVLRLLLRTEGSCYVTGRAVKSRLELVNVSKKPQVVLKTLDYYGDGGFMGVMPFINGQPDQWVGDWLDERRLFPPRAEQFTTLQPNESTLIWLDSFWDLTRDFVYRNGAPPGIYTLAVRYRNWFKGPAKFVLSDDNKSLDVAFTDLNAWTGVLFSDPITIRVVDWAWECGPATTTGAPS